MTNNQTNTYPTELKILDQTFKVLYFDNPSEVDPRGADSMYGHFDRMNHEIRIYNKDGLSEAEVWNSLIHESIHAIVNILKINEISSLDSFDEEHAVHLLATGLNALLHDNNLNFSYKRMSPNND